MYANENQFIFISIFYRQKNWHSLLTTLRQEIFDQPQIKTELEAAIIYLNHHRGEGVRLALKLKNGGIEKYKAIEHSISSFLIANPSENEDIKLPITSFFTDFANNQIKYNLFNERAIMPGGLINVQLLLSKILLVFFEDHPVDDEGIFTLLVYLQDAILNGMCGSEKLKHELCVQLIREMEKNEKYLSGEMVQTANMQGLYFPEEAVSIPGLSILLADVENASRLLYNQIGKLKSSYFTLMSIIQLHLFKISGELIFDSINHIHQSLQEDSIIR